MPSNLIPETYLLSLKGAPLNIVSSAVDHQFILLEILTEQLM